MEIRKLEILGFGKLARPVVLAPGFNVIPGPNRAGKSTFLALVVALLYGLDPTKRSKTNPVPERERYAPWDPGRPFQAAMEMVLDDGRVLRIEKDFNAGRTKVYDLVTGREIQDEVFSYNKALKDYEIGRELLGLSRPAFLSSVLVTRGALQNFDQSFQRGELVKALEAMVDVEGFTAAIERITTALRTHRGLTIKEGLMASEIEGLKKSIAGLANEIAELERERQVVEQELTQVEELSDQIAATRLEAERLRGLALLAELNDLESRRRHLATLQAEKAGLDRYAAFPAELESQVEAGWATYQQAAAELEEPKRQLQQRESELEKAQGEVSRLFPDLSRLSDEARRQIRQVLEKSLQVAGEITRLQEAREAEVRSLAEQGIDAVAVEAIYQRLEPATAADMTLLAQDAEALETLAHQEGELKRREQATLRQEAWLLEDRRRWVRWARWTAGGGILIGFGGTVLSLLGVGVPLWPPWLIGLLLLAGAFSLWILGRFYRSDELGRLRAGLEALRHEAQKLEEARHQQDERLAGVLARLGRFTELADLRAAYRRYSRERERCDRFLDLTRKLHEKEEELAKQEGMLQQLLTQGAGLAPQAPLEQDSMHQLAQRFLALEERETHLAGLLKQCERLRERIGALEKLRENAQATLTKLFQKLPAELPLTGDTLEAEIEDFKARCRQARRYAALIAEESRLQAGTTPEALDDRILKLRAALAHFPADFTTLTPEKSAQAYQEAEAAQMRRLTKLQEDFRRSREKALRSLDHIDALGEKRAKKEALERELVRIERFAQALELAKDRLATTARGYHRQWAERLNATAQEILTKISPIHTSLRFADDLSFTVISREKGGPLREMEIPYIFSDGEKALIFLTVRLAVVRALSSTGERLPLLLDDSLADLDDVSYPILMNFLSEEVSRATQVVLATCHEVAYRRWRDTQAQPPQVHEASFSLENNLRGSAMTGDELT